MTTYTIQLLDMAAEGHTAGPRQDQARPLRGEKSQATRVREITKTNAMASSLGTGGNEDKHYVLVLYLIFLDVMWPRLE